MFVPDEERRVWRFVGTVLARDRQHAARLHFGEVTERVEFSAVSVNAWKPEWRDPPAPRRGTLEMPDPTTDVEEESRDQLGLADSGGPAEAAELAGRRQS